MNASNRFGLIGDAVLRKEDARFLNGKGQFVSNIVYPDQLHAVFLRSPHAHADIEEIDIGQARSLPGVVAVLTGADMAADHVGPVPTMWIVSDLDGDVMKQPVRWPLARDRVRHVGEAVALIVAETQEQAVEAREAVRVTYAARGAVTDTAMALDPSAPELHASVPGNRVFTWSRGDADAAAAAIKSAPCSVDLEVVNNRLVCAALETRACLALHDPNSNVTVLHSATQAPHLIRRSVAEALGLSPNDIRVISPDVGGGFGTKGKHYPEETVIVWAARRLGRPLRWVSTRSEAFCSDTQARDHITRATLGLSEDGVFLGIELHTIANIGAYISTFGAAIPAPIYTALLAGVYRTPAVHIKVTGVVTNTVPVDAYRGAGRPEACYVLERLADAAARKLNLDRVEIRRRNLIPVEAMPYQTPIGPTYDCGNFPQVLEQLLQVSDWSGFANRRAMSASKGRYRGIGLALYVETSGVAPSRLAGMMGAQVGFFESAEIRIDGNGGIQVLTGTHNHGQGHQTSYAQIVADRLGLPFDTIQVTEGDTGRVPMGTGTFGSRSIAVGGSAIAAATDKIVEKGRLIAAYRLEAAPEDLSFNDGEYRIAGTDRTVSLGEVARMANLGHNLPPGVEPGLNESAFYDPPNFAYSNGGHVCEIEVDPETGAIEVQRYFTVDDVGTIINPMIVEGQIHGGLAQGVGQAMTENCVYDTESGQFMSGSFLDYCIPRADDLPGFAGTFDESQPCTHNPLGAKGCGESGSIGAPAALVSAALDALAPLGVSDLTMPLTPLAIWKAIEKASGQSV